MRKSYSIIIFLFLILSCKDKIKDQQNQEEFTIELKRFSAKSDPDCQPNSCTEISLTIPLITAPDTQINQQLNHQLFRVISDLVSFEQDSDLMLSYDQLIASFITSYNDFNDKFPDEDLPWKATADVSVSYINPEIIAFTISYYTFAGGAHGFKAEKSLILDRKTASVLTNKTLFKNWEQLQKLIQPKLTYYKELTNKQGVLDYPQDVFISTDSVVFTYNSFTKFPLDQGADKISFDKQSVQDYFTIPLIQNDTLK